MSLDDNSFEDVDVDELRGLMELDSASASSVPQHRSGSSSHDAGPSTGPPRPAALPASDERLDVDRGPTQLPERLQLAFGYDGVRIGGVELGMGQLDVSSTRQHLDFDRLNRAARQGYCNLHVVAEELNRLPSSRTARAGLGSELLAAASVVAAADLPREGSRGA